MVRLAHPVTRPALSVQIEKKFAAGDSPGFQLQLNEEFDSGFTVLFGSSGAGKSTLLDCIAGLHTPDAGRIRFGDEIIFDADKKIELPPQRRRVAYLLQSLALFPHLSVEENIAYGITANSASDRQSKIESALRSFHIAEHRRKKPRQLSGGEQQRAALARSLATDPRVLLLDEPLTGLDARLRETILGDLREWNAARQIPILYVTHNREELDAIGDRILVIEQGHIVARGNPREILDAPRSLSIAQTAGFENVLLTLVGKLRPDDGVMSVLLLPSNRELEVPLGAAQSGDKICVAIRAGDILVATEPPKSISARNILAGTVESVKERGNLVTLTVNAGARFIVHVTPAAVRALSLAPAVAVWLILKTHSCRVVAT